MKLLQLPDWAEQQHIVVAVAVAVVVGFCCVVTARSLQEVKAIVVVGRVGEANRVQVECHIGMAEAQEACQ